MTTRSPDGSTPPNDAPTLEAALKLVDEVVHDLNNALLVIRGYGSVLRTSLETPEQLADVDEIAKAVDHATLLTGKLLELARSGRPDGGDVRSARAGHRDDPARRGRRGCPRARLSRARERGLQRPPRDTAERG